MSKKRTETTCTINNIVDLNDQEMYVVRLALNHYKDCDEVISREERDLLLDLLTTFET